jgi:hypothetical protein
MFRRWVRRMHRGNRVKRVARPLRWVPRTDILLDRLPRSRPLVHLGNRRRREVVELSGPESSTSAPAIK